MDILKFFFNILMHLFMNALRQGATEEKLDEYNQGDHVADSKVAHGILF